MARIEGDLDEPLKWFAVIHKNTANPHVHLLIRGKGHEGKDLVIPREYISNGIRTRAVEVATQWLGERTREEAQIAIAKEVSAERWTSLDGTLARFAQPVQEGLRLDLKQVQINRYALASQEFLVGRLNFLEKAGLAQRVAPEKRTFVGRRPVWLLKPDFQKQLNDLAARHDVIKSLHSALGRDAAVVMPRIQRVRTDSSLASNTRCAVRGVVLAKGAINELTDERFLVLEDHVGKAHYVRLWASEQYEALRVGGIAEVGRSADARRSIGREIIQVVDYAKDGQYSTARHLEWIRAQSPRPASGQVEKRLSAFKSIVTKLAKKPESGIVLTAKRNAVTVDAAKVEQFIAARNRWPDLRVKVAFSLAEQVHAGAYTWLDRQLLRTGLAKKIPGTDLTHNVQVRSALTQRGDWLVLNGYARRKDVDGIQKLEFVPGAIARLLAKEQQELAQRCNEKPGKSLIYLREGQAVTGAYRGTVLQHRGGFALIETATSLVAAPVSRPPWMEKGQQVAAKGISPRYARIDLDQTGTKLKKLGLER
jgi:hypothetical protein